MAGVRYTLGRVTLVFKRQETEVDRTYSLVESAELPGAGAALHRHPGWEETFVVSGR